MDYKNGKIYKLYSPSKNIIYIGSTTQSLSKRLSKHLSDYKMYNNNSKHYYSSFLVLECEDYKIELLEEYECNNKQQLEKKEGEYIKNYECCNEFVAGRTRKEWYNDNIDKVKERDKKRYENNKEVICEQKKTYYKENKEKMKEYNKAYREANKEKINERKRLNYLKKQEKIV
jgi:Uri superfamily endonuclease